MNETIYQAFRGACHQRAAGLSMDLGEMGGLAATIEDRRPDLTDLIAQVRMAGREGASDDEVVDALNAVGKIARPERRPGRNC